MVAPLERNLAEVIRRHVRSGLLDTHVALPARVERVDLRRGRLDAQPLVMDVAEVGGERRAVPFPIVFDVPIWSPNGGGFRITFPVQRGDVCTLLFADRSIDTYLSTGGQVDPGDPRAHALSDAIVALPATNPGRPLAVASDAMVIGHESGFKVTIRRDAIDIGGGNFEGVPLGNTLRTWLLQLVTWLAGHSHAGAGAVNGPPPAVPEFVSGRVKVSS